MAEISIDSETPVIVGSTVVLNCRAKDLGWPEAQYRWKPPGSSYEFNSRTQYTVSNVQLTHAGKRFSIKDAWIPIPVNPVPQFQATTTVHRGTRSATVGKAR